MLKRFMQKPTTSLLISMCLGALVSGAPGLAQADDLLTVAESAAKERGATGQPLVSQQGKLEAKVLQRWPVQLEPRQCVVVAGAASDGTDLELSVKTPEGLSLADSETGPTARLRYCAGLKAEKAQMGLRSDAAGTFAIGAWAVRTGGEPTVTPTPTPAKVPKTLGQQLSTLAGEHAKGFEPMTPPREEDLGVGDSRERDLPLDAGRCYRVAAVADAPLTGVDLTLRDSQGKQVLAEKGGENTSILGEDAPFCPKIAARYKLMVSVEGGSGRVLWQVYGETQAETQSKWPVGGEGDSLVAKRIRTTHERLGEKKQPAVAYQEGRLETAQSVDVGFDVQPGFCYVAVAAGTPSIRSLDLEIVDQRGNLVAQSLDQGSLARARVCSDLKARWTTRVRVFKGYGEYGIQVFGGV